ncbi:alpha/beta hydrolase [Streptomyces gardneri]|uniref:alpha/beta fold hydrolase n=1 Tax=Nocardia TaxID=1817 RepID=UPI00135968B9|nr:MULTISPECIES: alpha/beta hydrolase [Nocardia]MBF6167277.1 alpha/beta hydrolase [Streptomyces gardneri]MBF6204636.1 alpha/beta hydrolase [Streptomyces gardneri]UAK33047.1 alpha/beta hydrolase [Nocardia asteroides]
MTMSSDASQSSAAARGSTRADQPQPIKALHLGSGDPLLLLHGFMMSPHSWEQTAARLSTHCEVFAPAFAGHWGGAPADGRSIDVYALADQICDQLDELGWRTCHIAGNSLGGRVGVELARRGRARTLTLIAPTGGWHAPSLTQWRIKLKFLSLVPLVEIGKRLGGFAIGNPLARRIALLALTKHAAAVSRRDAAAALAAALHCPAMIPMILGALRAPEQEDLSTLRTPVRLLLSEYDRVIPNRVYARRYLKELPESADRILVNGVGHVPMLEAPDRIATLIAEHVYASRTRLRAV